VQKKGHILEQLSLRTGTGSSKIKEIKEYNSRFKLMTTFIKVEDT
jgi:hypothetical protein